MSEGRRIRVFAASSALLIAAGWIATSSFELAPRHDASWLIVAGAALLLAGASSWWLERVLAHPPDPRAERSSRPPGAHGEVVLDELADERDRLETILERMDDAVLALDQSDRITMANDAAFSLLDFDDDDVDRPLLDAVPVPQLLELAQACQRRPNRKASAEFQLPKPPHYQVLAKAAPLKRMGGCVIVIQDVTDMRRLERMRRDFVANVSHELRTPVSVIRANAETLLDGGLGDETRAPSFVEAILRNSERLSDLMRDLLDLSRIEAGKLEIDIKPLSVHDAAHTVADSVALRAADRGVSIHNEVDPAVQVMADRTALVQILQNLVDNAVKYAVHDVTLRAVDSAERVRIEVEDDGPGIAPQHRQRVFERFYRVDAGRSRELGGTGLGLAIVKHASEQMRGSVGVRPGPARGSIFWVELPGVPPAEAARSDQRPRRVQKPA